MNKKTYGLILLFNIYILSFSVGFFVVKKIYYISLNNNFADQNNNSYFLIIIFVGNVISTIIVWLIGIGFGTASVYDPYWSVQTPVIYTCLLIYYNNANVGNIIFLILILFWAIRLTYNFSLEFNDISYIDWRYKLIKENTGCLYQLVNLVGICLVPTIIVYVASIPAYLYIMNNNSLNEHNVLGFIIMLVSTLLEKKADDQMRAWRKKRRNKEDIINFGLWKKSRHPNYLGEICFWYGVGTVYCLPDVRENISVMIGAVLDNLLFLFISIPLAEGNLKRNKKNFSEYKKKTNMLLPF